MGECFFVNVIGCIRNSPTNIGFARNNTGVFYVMKYFYVMKHLNIMILVYLMRKMISFLMIIISVKDMGFHLKK